MNVKTIRRGVAHVAEYVKQTNRSSDTEAARDVLFAIKRGGIFAALKHVRERGVVKRSGGLPLLATFEAAQILGLAAAHGHAGVGKRHIHEFSSCGCRR